MMSLRVDTIVSTCRDSCLNVQRLVSQRAETLISTCRDTKSWQFMFLVDYI